MKNTTKKIVVYAVLAALMLLFGALPIVFLIPVLFACIAFDFKTSLFAGCFYGVISLAYAFLGSSFVSLAFISLPFVPIVGRILSAGLCNLSFKLYSKLFKKQTRMSKALPIALAGATGSLLNTAIIVSLLLLFAKNIAFEGVTLYVTIPFMLISGAIELVASAVILPPVVLTLRKAGVIETPQIKIKSNCCDKDQKGKDPQNIADISAAEHFHQD